MGMSYNTNPHIERVRMEAVRMVEKVTVLHRSHICPVGIKSLQSGKMIKAGIFPLLFIYGCGSPTP